MAMFIKDVHLECRFLPIMLTSEGTTQISIRKGYQDGDLFVITDTVNVTASLEDTCLILDAAPIDGLTRRQDLVVAIFNWCKANGHIDESTELTLS